MWGCIECYQMHSVRQAKLDDDLLFLKWHCVNLKASLMASFPEGTQQAS